MSGRCVFILMKHQKVSRWSVCLLINRLLNTMFYVFCGTLRHQAVIEGGNENGRQAVSSPRVFVSFLDGLLKYFSALLLVIKGHVESGIQKDLEDIVCRKHKQCDSVVPAISVFFWVLWFPVQNLWSQNLGRLQSVQCNNMIRYRVLQVDLFSDLFSCHLPQAVMVNYVLQTVCPEQGKC